MHHMHSNALSFPLLHLHRAYLRYKNAALIHMCRVLHNKTVSKKNLYDSIQEYQNYQ